MIDLTLKKPPINLVGITGSPRSGKSMLAPIVSSLKKAETFKMDYTIEQIVVLNYLGISSDNATKYLMRYSVNFLIYNSMIGRNTNFRFSDWTSIWNSIDPTKYVKRLVSDEGDFIFKKIKEKKLLIPFFFHNALWHAEIFFQSFPDIKMVHINRHPVDVIHSWYRRGYGTEFYLKELNATTLFNYKNKKLPYYARGWEEEYLRLSDMDRIIKMINFINSNHNKSFHELSTKHQKQVLIINFDKMVTEPKIDLMRITKFLNTEKTSYTDTVMIRQRCPREIDMNARDEKYDEIKKTAMADSIQLLQEMIYEYELQASK